nr:glycosyltransferase family 2 protein [uncultured Agathobaculum sp.]
MISIIVPIYNEANFLTNLIQSILTQLIQDYEVILVDDGSTDSTGRLCKKAAAQDSRFRYIYQKNSGVSSARNHGMKEAKGDFITFLDADDYIPPNYLKELLNICSNSDIAICDVVIQSNGIQIKRFTHSQDTLTQTQSLNTLLLRQDINSGPCAKLFRRTVVEGLTFPPLKAYEDILFVKDAFCRANSIAVTNRTEYIYIQNPQGAMSNFVKMPSPDIIRATDELLKFIITRGDLDPKTFYITASHLMQYVHVIMRQSASKHPNFLVSVQNLYRRYIRQIIECPAFPWKEKIIYVAFAYGYFFNGKYFLHIKRE